MAKHEGIDDTTTLGELSGDDIDAEMAFDVKFGRYKNLNVFCPWCEHKSTSNSKSCSVNREGMFVCKSCRKKGDAVAFYAQRTSTTPIASRKALKRSPTASADVPVDLRSAPPVTEEMVEACSALLVRTPSMRNYINRRRGITDATAALFRLGCDERRITIPTHYADGTLAGIRRYLPDAKTSPKMVAHGGGTGEALLYPQWMLDRARSTDQPYIILCEGEWDCMLLVQMGFDAITVTSGVATWAEMFTASLMAVGKPVVIIYDVNDKSDHTGEADLGQRIAAERATLLTDAGLTVKVVRLPLPATYFGGDVTNWYIDERRTTEELETLIHDTTIFGTSVSTGTPDVAARIVTLHDAANARYYYETIHLRCLVAGRTTSPYIIPSKITAEVEGEDGIPHVITKTFTPYDGSILSLVDCTRATQKTTLKTLLGLDPKAKATITVDETMNVEEVFLIPAVDGREDGGVYCLRQAYYAGHGLRTNTVYDFKGYTLPHPQNQSATHVLTSAVRSETNLDACVLSPETVDILRATFATNDVHAKLDDIAAELSTYVTRIYGRPDLHVAIDLAFHSVIGFSFEGHAVRKGWLDVLIVGDTRTGKGYVTEGLSRHYGVGDLVSGENISFAGLVGGVEKMGDRFSIMWGKIPLADKRAVIIDEASNLDTRDFGKLSRIRSEGVAEITKIRSERTTARTRLIWLANPRPSVTGEPRRVDDYGYGILCVPELVGAAEDIARFDYALVVAQNEVASDVINLHRAAEGRTCKYDPAVCRQLISWIWSRTPEQVVFASGVTDLVMRAAKSLGRAFSPKVCLIQAEDVRFKLLRIAAAVAARTFSTPDGVSLLVTTQHVEYAYNFLHHVYSKPACGYAQLSAAEKEASTLRDRKKVLESMQQAGDCLVDLVAGLLSLRRIVANDLCDYAGVDLFQARTIISELVRLRALDKDYSHYVKKPAFTAFLQDLRMQLVKDPYHLTVEDDEGETDE